MTLYTGIIIHYVVDFETSVYKKYEQLNYLIRQTELECTSIVKCDFYIYDYLAYGISYYLAYGICKDRYSLSILNASLTYPRRSLFPQNENLTTERCWDKQAISTCQRTFRKAKEQDGVLGNPRVLRSETVLKSG